MIASARSRLSQWEIGLVRYKEKAAQGLEACKTVQREDKMPQVWMCIIALLKPLNTHKQADLGSWISPWPSEYICGPWD